MPSDETRGKAEVPTKGVSSGYLMDGESFGRSVGRATRRKPQFFPQLKFLVLTTARKKYIRGNENLKLLQEGKARGKPCALPRCLSPQIQRPAEKDGARRERVEGGTANWHFCCQAGTCHPPPKKKEQEKCPSASVVG